MTLPMTGRDNIRVRKGCLTCDLKSKLRQVAVIVQSCKKVRDVKGIDEAQISRKLKSRCGRVANLTRSQSVIPALISSYL